MMYAQVMIQELNLSKARAQLSGLVKKIKKNPDMKVRITAHGIPVVELRAIPGQKPRKNGGEVLLDLAQKMGLPDESYPKSTRVSEDHDNFL